MNEKIPTYPAEIQCNYIKKKQPKPYAVKDVRFWLLLLEFRLAPLT
jgi:hypothetical protein